MIHLTPIPKVRMKSVTIIGSGNWGSAIAKIVGNNTARYPDIFEKQVTAWIKLSFSISDDCFSSFHYYVIFKPNSTMQVVFMMFVTWRVKTF